MKTSRSSLEFVQGDPQLRRAAKWGCMACGCGCDQVATADSLWLILQRSACHTALKAVIMAGQNKQCLRCNHDADP